MRKADDFNYNIMFLTWAGISEFYVILILMRMGRGDRYVCQSRMSYFGYVAEVGTKWDKGR